MTDEVSLLRCERLAAPRRGSSPSFAQPNVLHKTRAVPALLVNVLAEARDEALSAAVFRWGSASFRRIPQLDAGWISISPSADALSVELEKLRDIAGRDVPVIGCHVGEPTAKAVEGYRLLGIEHIVVELPTEPRDKRSGV